MLVDTSAWVAAIRGAPQQLKAAVDRLLATGRAATNHVISAELLIGAKNTQERDELESDLAALPHLSISDSIWIGGGRLGLALRRKGLTVGLPDLVIAACSIAYECELLCADRDFDLIAHHAPLKLHDAKSITRR